MQWVHNNDVLIGQWNREKFNYVGIAYNDLNLRKIILKNRISFLSIKWINQNIGTHLTRDSWIPRLI